MDQTVTGALTGFYLEVLIGWVVGAAIVGAAAHARRRSGVGWFLLALLISPLLAFIAVLVMAPGGRKTCPECGMGVPVEARICHFCRHQFDEYQKPDLPEGSWQDVGMWRVVEANDTDEVAVGDHVLVGLGPSQLLLVQPEERTPRLWLPYDEVAIGLGNDGRVRLSDKIAYLAALEHISGPDARSLVESVRAHQQG
jgi:hypothetical protein